MPQHNMPAKTVAETERPFQIHRRPRGKQGKGSTPHRFRRDITGKRTPVKSRYRKTGSVDSDTVTRFRAFQHFMAGNCKPAGTSCAVHLLICPISSTSPVNMATPVLPAVWLPVLQPFFCCFLHFCRFLYFLLHFSGSRSLISFSTAVLPFFPEISALNFSGSGLSAGTFSSSLHILLPQDPHRSARYGYFPAAPLPE